MRGVSVGLRLNALSVRRIAPIYSTVTEMHAAMRARAVCAEMRCAIRRRSLSSAKMRTPKRPALQLTLSSKTRLENFAASSNTGSPASSSPLECSLEVTVYLQKTL
eukprot:Gb_11840 [translate_table: standard]